MVDVAQIKEHMNVVGSDGQHVGTVDHMQDGAIKLTKSDPTSGGQHHMLPLECVEAVEGDTLRLNVTAAEAASRERAV